MNQLVQRAFFGKNNCLKVSLNSQKECYFHFGTCSNEKWNWKKVKMTDTEIADITLVLENKKQSTSFFHKYNNETTQVWINRSGETVFIKVKELSKQLTLTEQKVLEVLLKNMIWIINTNVA